MDTTRVRTVLATMILAILVAFAVGCGKEKNEAAAQKCIESAKKSGTLCQNCCKNANAPGHYWRKGDGCKCL